MAYSKINERLAFICESDSDLATIVEDGFDSPGTIALVVSGTSLVKKVLGPDKETWYTFDGVIL